MRVKILPLVFMTLLLIVPSQMLLPSGQANASTPGFIERVYTDKARYEPGELVTVTAQINNSGGTNWSGDVTMTIFHLENAVYSSVQHASIASGQTTDVTFSWTSDTTDFKGYFVSVDAGSLGQGYSSIDVSSDFAKYPRYGYISEFSSNETAAESAAKVNELAQDYKINAWQFYDWMWRHETMIKRTGGTIDPTWIDLFNRQISWPTINNQIAAIHNQNGAAMAYAMIYAARENYSGFGVNPEWGMYMDPAHTKQLDVDFGNNSTYMYLFDPANAGWQQFIHEQYLDAIQTANFDGIHIDQMGQRNNIYDYSGNSIDLATRFTPFIKAAKTKLTAANSNQDFMTFNIVDGTVNGWAANDVSKNANVDFLYSEIWHLSNSYMQLKDYIDSLRANSGNKAVVLAAYMNYGENIGDRYEAEDAALQHTAVNTDHAGYTGSGFVDQFADVNDSVTFTITAPEEGYYSLVFRFANHSGYTATRNLYVDSNFEIELPFQNQPNWDTWSHETWHQVYLTPGTHTIKLSYDSSNTGAINLDSLTLGTFDEHSIRLADAMMAASGATHIELGEDSQMLAHEYYPNRSKSMRSTLKSAMKDHYNFITAYENLLFDADVIDNDAGKQFINIAGVNTSPDGAANTVWHMSKRTPEYNILHLINLVNNDQNWRNSGNQPTAQTNLATKVYIGAEETITGVYAASPDHNQGATQSLPFTTGTDSSGSYISFTVPSLEYWSMIYMKRSTAAPVDNMYEAETAIKSNVSVNTNHAGYTGSGFVDQFATVNDGVSFIVHASSKDDYVLRFRYSNGGSDANRDVFLNGKYAGTVQLKHTGGWNQWAYGELTVPLAQGSHSVVLWYNSSNSGAVNLDHLKLDKTYIWQFDRQIASVPAGYRITFKAGLPGWVHFGTDNWKNVMDIPLASNGSSDSSLNYEASIGPFPSATTVDVTFLWDDNNNGILEDMIDRWEGTDFQIAIP
uniref:Cycloisomaltooligosaccharide glucanotransferase n=1 Tax=Niallia circulans TaxID=1397 RepID=CTA2_NIACI|nr:RecName: Full=Cycloisomaltooligosaccharide glucanotransferase; Short=CITase; Flags: Precursor [Niallia circulans]BAA13595.1 CITase (cycloisomaltooligosaccharide glucanotransferase) precursor [Niallia circulans]